jgi:cell fate regulator YaaT (PSP1 superfamily)
MDKYVWVRMEWNNYVELYKYSGFDIEEGAIYIIETKHAKDFGRALISPVPVDCDKIYKTSELPKIIKKASYDDLKLRDNLRRREDRSYKTASEKIEKHSLFMKLINVYHFYDGTKVLFNFYSDGRVDFRNLVKDLASVFKTRIELHQIGVRDEAQLIGGYGVCGIQYCCQMLKTNKEPISIKMAKEQNLPLNAMKISGACGRLMCCLDFEYSDYADLHSADDIQIGAIVNYDATHYFVKEINVDTREVILSGENGDYQMVSLERIRCENETFIVISEEEASYLEEYKCCKDKKENIGE